MKILLASDSSVVLNAYFTALAKIGAASITTTSSIGETYDILMGGSDFGLLIVDQDLPDLAGLGEFRKMRETAGTAPLALIPSREHDDIVQTAIMSGVTATLPRKPSATELELMIGLLAAGRTFAVFEYGAPGCDALRASGLSDREFQVLRGVCQGMQNKEIAHAFNIKEVTVKMHVRAIIRKLSAKNRTHAAMIARDLKLV